MSPHLELWPWPFLALVALLVFGRMMRIRRWRSRRQAQAPREANEAESGQTALIEALEGRVADLEERLDFTERLLASRSEPAR